MHKPCNENEINEIIKEFAPSKATGPYSIPVPPKDSMYTTPNADTPD